MKAILGLKVSSPLLHRHGYGMQIWDILHILGNEKKGDIVVEIYSENNSFICSKYMKYNLDEETNSLNCEKV